MPKDKLIDWTLTEAPDDAPAVVQAVGGAPAPQPPAYLPRLSRRAWLILAAIVLLTGLALGLPALEYYRTRNAVAVVIAQQEQARLASDWDALRESFAEPDASWTNEQIAQLQGNAFSLPLWLPGVGNPPEAGRLAAFQIVGQQLVRADVVRAFQLDQGSRQNFAQPQFYQFDGDTWKQVAPPKVADPVQSLHGTYVDLQFYAADAERAPGLVRDLDAILAQACADWDCPPNIRVPVNFKPAGSSGGQFDVLAHSLTLQMLFGHFDGRSPDISLLSALVGGYPADAEAAEAVRRAVGVQVLLLAAQQIAPGGFDDGKFYRDALVVREAVRLGLDRPELLSLQIANPIFYGPELWQAPAVDYFSNGGWLQALVFLNNLLVDQPLSTERRLLHTFSSARDAQDWMVAGLVLRLSSDEVYEKLSAAAAFNAPVPTLQPMAFTPELALNCPEGVVLATLAGQSARLFGATVPDNQLAGWSPDARRLALIIAGRLAVVDLTTGESVWSDEPLRHGALYINWASDSVIIYPPARTGAGRVSTDFQDPDLILFDAAVSHSNHRFEGISYYLPSPNNSAAAIGNANSPTPFLIVLPAEGGQALFSAPNGSNPAWSPDSRQLAYVVRETDAFSLVLADPATGEIRPLLSSADPGVPPMLTGNRYGLTLTPAWSPAGDRLALPAYTYDQNGPTGWLGLIRADGQDFHLLPLGLDQVAPYRAEFSADGQFLAVDLGSQTSHGLAIYSVANETLLHWIPGHWSGGWSPTGHNLLLNHETGPTLLRDPADPTATPQPLGPAGCFAAAWRP